MMTTAMLVCLAAGPVAVAPSAHKLCTDEAWYKESKQAEKTLVGVVEVNPGGGTIVGNKRFCSFRLTWLENDKPVSRPLFLKGKDYLIAPLVGHQVSITGKLIDEEFDGKRVSEIWPARLDDKGDAPYGGYGEWQVLAKYSGWFGRNTRPGEPEPSLIRDGNQLTGLMGYRGANADQLATQQMCQRLGVSSIDWTKQMVLTINGGQQRVGTRIEIMRIVVKEKNLDVHYKVSPGNAAAGIAYVAETVLVKKYDGEIHFITEGGKPKIISPLDDDAPEEKPTPFEPKK